MVRGGSVHILTNYNNEVFYIGVTSDLLTEHKEKYYPSLFTSKYNCYKLVYFEHFINIEEAINKEKQLKNWKRQWKINLINNFNPNWEDLFYKLEEEI